MYREIIVIVKIFDVELGKERLRTPEPKNVVKKGFLYFVEWTQGHRKSYYTWFRSCFHKICNLGRNKYIKGDFKVVKITPPPLWPKFFTFRKLDCLFLTLNVGSIVTSKSGFEMQTTLTRRAFRHKTMEDSLWVGMGQPLKKWMFSAPFLKTATSRNR